MAGFLFSDAGTLAYTDTPERDIEDNKVYRFAVAHTTLTVGTLYAILPGAAGCVTAALADDSKVYRVGVARVATTATNVARLQTGGYGTVTTPSLSVTAGHTLGIGGGAIVDEGAAPPINAKTFAINVTTTTTATSHTVILLDREVTAST